MTTRDSEALKKNALIIGASRGIGAGFAKALAARGDFGRVICAARQPASSEALRHLAATSSICTTIELDVTDEESIIAAAANIASLPGHLDLVINTVGLLHDDAMRPERRLQDIEARNIRRSFEVNSIAPLMLAKHLCGLLPKREPCVWATLSARVGSISDNRLGGWYAYRAAKAAQNMFNKTLSIELKRTHKKICVVALHPGTVATDLSAPFRSNVTADNLFTVETSVEHLLRVIDNLGENDNGSFYAWDGQKIPW
ncbi:MAG: SDR family oxidoreductase [Pseudomonadota bacterium]